MQPNLHAHSRVRSLVATLALFCAGVAGSLHPQVAQALPASCSTTGNLCMAPVITPWVYVVDPKYGRPDIGPFSSEGEAIAATIALSGGGWCSMVSSSPAVTYDDDGGQGATPSYIGSIDVHHGDTLHFNVVGYVSDTPPCAQSFASNASLYANRQVLCLNGWSLIYDTSVTPNVPLCLSSNTTWQPAKVACPVCAGGSQAAKGDGVDDLNQNKQQMEIDYVGAGANPLRLVRTYNSMLAWKGISDQLDALGSGWSATYFQRLLATSVTIGGTPVTSMYAFRPTGAVLNFNLVGGQWARVGDDISDTLTSTASGYEYRTADNTIESYDSSGRLTSIKIPGKPEQTLSYSGSSLLPSSVSTAFGQSLSFGYTTLQNKPRLTTVTDPAGSSIVYAYNANVRPASVTYPDGTSRAYGYDASFPTDLNSLTDEAGVAYASWVYDGAYGIRESLHAGGVEHYLFHYDLSNSKTDITDPLGAQRHNWFVMQWGIRRFYAADSSCGGCVDDFRRYNDANGNPSLRLDFNSNRTSYLYDTARNLETRRTEADSTAKARTITTTWDPIWRKPSLITEPNRTTALTYDANGNELTKTITDTTVTPNTSRTWTWTYDSDNHVLSEDGPRTEVSDVTTYAYYGATDTCSTTIAGSSATGCRGQLSAVTNALSQITTFNEYNAHGQPIEVTDPNGVTTTLAYDARERLTSRQVGSETTAFSYWPTGLLKRVTLPDSSYVQYTYDNAHRLYKIEDASGNHVQYTLDNMGIHTAENTYDPSNALVRTRTQVFNTLNQLWKQVPSAGTAAVTTVLSYDANNNLTATSAPLSRNTSNQYDELNRLKQITDPASGITLLGYDANDNLTSVKDPRTFTTSYAYNGFGDLVTQLSPDTGGTTNTYDSGGNLATSTDARGAVATYGYDALNRVSSVAYSLGGTADQTVSFTYDGGTNGKGHLTGASDAHHSMSWGYDALGRVTSQSESVGGVSLPVTYGYTNADLTSIVTPSRQALSFGYNANHQIVSVSVNGTTVLNSVTYEPLGPVNGWTWGNATTASRTYDADGKVSQIADSGTKTFSYDDAFRITGITDTSTGASNWTFGYDLLDRITSGSISGGTTRGWTYDASGNRLTETGSAPSTYSISSTSNQITGISGSLARTYAYDATGNTLSYSTVSATYNDAGRLETLAQGGTTETLIYNALGQRIETSGGAAGTVLYAYDEAGHLLGEYDGSGNLIEETVWLGDIPVATLRPHTGGGIDIFYVHTDQLNTPRAVSRPSDNALMWTWYSDPFGTDAANENPAGAGTFQYNLRFAGQIFDGQAGLHYNYTRYYDPAVGGYTQSDLAGLDGGASTYAYADGNSISEADATGLDPSGGPYHPKPEAQVKLKCTDDDSCTMLSGKMWVLMRMINSHQMWDWLNPPPGGGRRHAKEIADLWRAYARCQSLHKQKCENCPPKQESGVPSLFWVPGMTPAPGMVPGAPSPESAPRLPLEPALP